MDTQKVPDADPENMPYAVPMGNRTTFIAINLESTGLPEYGIPVPHITQIAAIEIESSEPFSIYVLPKLPVSQGAFEVNHTVVNGNEMRVHGQLVDTVSIETALKEFCKWLNKFPNVVLVAHTGDRFVYELLIPALVNTNTADLFRRRVTGLIDSLPIFITKFPQLRSHRLEDLMKAFFEDSYDASIAHNAINDVECIRKLVNEKLSSAELQSKIKSPQEYF